MTIFKRLERNCLLWLLAWVSSLNLDLVIAILPKSTHLSQSREEQLGSCPLYVLSINTNGNMYVCKNNGSRDDCQALRLPF